MKTNRLKHIAIGFYRTLGIGLATLVGALIILILALVTGADMEVLGLAITQ